MDSQNKIQRVNGVAVPYDEDVQKLTARIAQKDPSWGAAMLALAFHQDSRAKTLLIEYAGAKDERLRRSALEALALSEDAPQYAELFLMALGDPSQYIVRSACHIVAELRLACARPMILPLLYSSDDSTCSAALAAMEAVAVEEDLQRVLKIFLKRKDRWVHNQAGCVLLALTNSSTWRSVFDAFRADSTARHRVWACELIAQFGIESDARLLNAMAADADGHVRKAAQRAASALQQRSAQEEESSSQTP